MMPASVEIMLDRDIERVKAKILKIGHEHVPFFNKQELPDAIDELEKLLKEKYSPYEP